jgi:hypothetical protein
MNNGVCEFEMRWRVVRCHVGQIESIKEDVDEDVRLFYDLRLRDNTNVVTYELTDFDDFLDRIEEMSPSTKVKRHPTGQRRRDRKRRAE